MNHPKNPSYHVDKEHYGATHGYIVVPVEGGEPLFVSLNSFYVREDAVREYTKQFPEFTGIVTVVMFLPNIDSTSSWRFEIERTGVTITPID